MKPFQKVGDIGELRRAEWKKHPEKFEADVQKGMRAHPDKTRYQVETMIRKLPTGDLFRNDVYTVIVRSDHKDWIWLSIKRNDKQSIHDWRDFQEIKNMLVGLENEGLELYPAESRKVDTANQYHLYVLKSLDRLPVGYSDRLVLDADPEDSSGVVQRSF